MKAITWILILIVIIGGIVLLTKNRNEERTPDDATASMKVMGYDDGVYSIVPEESTINWSGSFLNGSRTHVGTIAVADGSVVIEAAEPVSGTVTIDMDSIVESNDSPVVDHLKTDDFFNVAAYPTATFVVKEVTMRDDISVGSLVTGDLTIRDVTKEVTIPVVVSGTPEGGITISGETEIDRAEWQVKYGSSKFFGDLGDQIIDDMIMISFTLAGEKAAQ